MALSACGCTASPLGLYSVRWLALVLVLLLLHPFIVVVRGDELVLMAVMPKGEQRCYEAIATVRDGGMESATAIAEWNCHRMRQPDSPRQYPCYWMIMVDPADHEDCVARIAAHMENLLQSNNVETSRSLVTLPVEVAGTNLYFLSRGEDTLAADAHAFCTSRGINEGEACIPSLIAAAGAIYEERRRHGDTMNSDQSQPPPSLVVDCPRHPPSPVNAPLPPVVVFWHIAIMKETDGELYIAQDQYQAMLASGLASAVDQIFVHVVGPIDLLQASPIFPFPPPFILHPVNQSLDSFEFGTLSALQGYCRDNIDARVAYVHTKGASRMGGFSKGTIWAWRKYMEHFVIHRYGSCLTALQRGYDTCGAQFKPDAKYYEGKPQLWHI